MPALPRVAGIERATAIRGHVLDRRMLAQLQRAHVGDDQPAIADGNLFRVALHGAEAVGDHVVEVAGPFLAQAILVVRRRLAQAALHDHALPVAEPSVARRAVDVEALLSAHEILAADRKRELIDRLSADLAGVERFVVAQPAARDRARRRRP